jgi:cytoskeletal protein RodZ
MATYRRGVITTGDLSAAGLFQSRSLPTTLETVLGEDENGNVKAAQNFNPTEKVSLEMILDTSATTFDGLLARAQAQSTASTPITVTIGTAKYLVDTITPTEGNKAFKRGTVDGTRYTANTIPA